MKETKNMDPIFLRSDGKPYNPLLEPPVLDIIIPELKAMPGERKVRRGFILPDGNFLFGITDSTGAYDQPHFIRGKKGVKAHYRGKGLITASFELFGRQLASQLIATDYLPLAPYAHIIPPEYDGRCTAKLPAKKMFPTEDVIRTGGEGSMVDKSQKGDYICGQRVPTGLKFGDSLPRPFFTPTTKAPPGQKDRPIPLEEFYAIIGNKDYANYIYGMSVLLHLLNKKVALRCGLDRPDQKKEFGLFEQGLPVYYPEFEPEPRKWTMESASLLFSELCLACGMRTDAWKHMPLFNLGAFCEFAQYNAEARIIRLCDEYGGTEDGRYRPIADTLRGRKLIAAGSRELAMVFLENYYCKEYFRLFSKRTGRGGYNKSATQRVYISRAVLQETGRRNLMARLMLGQYTDPAKQVDPYLLTK
jgi:phosphoribosylaminoimidazole-succinocarboxamide synthase